MSGAASCCLKTNPRRVCVFASRDVPVIRAIGFKLCSPPSSLLAPAGRRLGLVSCRADISSCCLLVCLAGPPLKKAAAGWGCSASQPGLPSSAQRCRLTLTMPAYRQTCFLDQWLSDLQGNRPSEHPALTNNTACVSQRMESVMSHLLPGGNVLRIWQRILLRQM